MSIDNKIIFAKHTKKNDDGSYDTTWRLGEDQVNFLLTFAITKLVAEGVAVEQEIEDIGDSSDDSLVVGVFDDEVAH